MSEIVSETRLIMGMPVIIRTESSASSDVSANIFERLSEIDRRYSPYLKDSEVSRVRSGRLDLGDVSAEFRSILELAQTAKVRTNGYFDVMYQGQLEPSGVVKGWAIEEAAIICRQAGLSNFIIEIAGDMICSGANNGRPWRVGVRSPLDPNQTVKVLALEDTAIATSGTSERGEHILNPYTKLPPKGMTSLTVVGPSIVWADIFATAAFAMGRSGIEWIEGLQGYEGLMIDKQMRGIATTGFGNYTL